MRRVTFDVFFNQTLLVINVFGTWYCHHNIYLFIMSVTSLRTLIHFFTLHLHIYVCIYIHIVTSIYVYTRFKIKNFYCLIIMYICILISIYVFIYSRVHINILHVYALQTYIVVLKLYIIHSYIQKFKYLCKSLRFQNYAYKS